MKSKFDNTYEIGHLFGEWKLLNNIPLRIPKKSSTTKDKHTLKFLCLCTSCNTEHLVDCYNLEKSISKRCYKCSMKNTKGCNNPFWKGYGKIGAKFLSRAKHGASLRKINFNLTLEELDRKWHEQKEICALSGKLLTLEEASIDRIDSDGIYEYNNIQWVHKDINLMKNHLNQEYFIEMCNMVSFYKGGACEIK